MSDARNTVRTLWHGSALSIYEELSLRSFVRCGHDVELYSYNDLTVPSGVTLRDASEILPSSAIFQNEGGWWHGGFASFSDLFRYKLLFERGGIWADLDTLCVKPLHDLPVSCVGWYDATELGNGFMKFELGHRLCKDLYERAKLFDENFVFAKTNSGPALLTQLLTTQTYCCDTLPISVLYPIHYSAAWKLFDPDQAEFCEQECAESHCIHWWNSQLSSIGMPKEALPPRGSFFHTKATEVLENNDLPAWSESSFRAWMENAQRREDAFQTISTLKQKLKRSEDRYSALETSAAWRMTYPLRAATGFIPETLRRAFGASPRRSDTSYQTDD